MKKVSKRAFMSGVVKLLKSQMDNESNYANFIFAIIINAVGDGCQDKLFHSTICIKKALIISKFLDWDVYQDYLIMVLQRVNLQKTYSVNSLVVKGRKFCDAQNKMFTKYCNLIGIDEEWAEKVIIKEFKLYDDIELKCAKPEKRALINKLYHDKYPL